MSNTKRFDPNRYQILGTAKEIAWWQAQQRKARRRRAFWSAMALLLALIWLGGLFWMLWSVR